MHNIQPKTLFIGKNCIYLPSCHSTNDVAAEMIQNQQIIDGTIVITSEQTAGRGQRGNSWEAMPNQNLTISIVLKPSFLLAKEQFQLNIAISLAVYDFLHKYLQTDALKIKWPNDIFLDDKKMGGILIENSIMGQNINYAVVGIGLNINQLVFKEARATSLAEHLKGVTFRLEILVAELCESIEKQYLLLRNQKSIMQKERYLQCLFAFDEPRLFIKNEQPILAKIVAIDSIGRLGLSINNRVEYFYFKEISYVF